VKAYDEVFVDYKSAPADVGQQLGFSKLWVGNWKTGVSVGPSIAVADYFSALSNRNITQPTDLWEWKADASKIRGNHILKFGGGLTQNGVRVSNQLAQMDMYLTQVTPTCSLEETHGRLPTHNQRVGDAISNGGGVPGLPVPVALAFGIRLPSVRRNDRLAGAPLSV
jgi:hypothetical protein